MIIMQKFYKTEKVEQDHLKLIEANMSEEDRQRARDAERLMKTLDEILKPRVAVTRTTKMLLP